MSRALSSLLILASFLIISSCNKPSGVGADLVLEDRVNFFFTDEIKVSMKTVIEDSIRIYDPRPDRLLNSRYYWGKIEDHLFGSSRSAIYAQLIPTSYNPEFADPATDSVYTIDSVILTLRYSDVRTFGHPDNPVGMKVFEVTEEMDYLSPVYSNKTYETGEMLGQLQFVPKPKQQVLVDTIVRDPHVRIPLDPEFGQRLLDAPLTDFLTDVAFTKAFNGIFLQPTDETDQLVAFNFFNALSGITLYYRTSGGVTNSYRMAFNRLHVIAPNFENDYTGTPVLASIESEDTKAEKYYMQGLGGVNIAVSFDNLDLLAGSIINKAEIEFAIAQENINSIFPPPNQIILAQKRDGEFAVVRDVTVSNNTGNPNPFHLFGGTLQRLGNEDPDALIRLPETSRYKMNITGVLHDILMNKVEENTIYLRVYPKIENPARTVIAGPGHADLAPKVRVYYTPIE
jgi:predicted small secreted protein